MGVSKSLNCLLKFGSFVFVVMFCVVRRQVDLWVFFFVHYQCHCNGHLVKCL